MTRRLDPVGLIYGLVSLALGALLLCDAEGWAEVDGGWLGAALAAALGCVLLASGLAARSEAASTSGSRGYQRGTTRISIGSALLAVSVLLVLREAGVWWSDGLVWPIVLAAAGASVIWSVTRGGSSADLEEDDDPPELELAASGGVLSGATLGAALVFGAGLLFLYLNGALSGQVGDVVLAAFVMVLAAGLILTPLWARLARGLAAERSARIRSQERAEVAAHLHDSVLQTLALIQRRADDPREVAALARRQERELRSWLWGARAQGTEETFASALEAAATEVEAAHGVELEVVAVGDAPISERGAATVAAAREAMVNASKFAGEAGPVAVFAEVADGAAHVFVRDRGPGFDPDEVPEDRRGVRDSIVGRMERHGGRAEVRATPGSGAEVELSIRLEET